jgi:LuxR family maltose regulon positive regulatory protein
LTSTTPQPHPRRVRRQRLFDMLDAGVQGSLTLVCAGAGWGKSELVSTWAAGRRYPTAWLTLDKSDNDADVFWSHVWAALQAAGAVPQDGRPAGLASVPADDGERVRSVARGLDGLSEPVVLVLDDFQEIDDPTLTQELAALLRYPRETFRVVLISRADPALPLQRLRAAGELTEIRDRDLAFTADEAAELLADQGLDLSGDDVTGLVDRTEGWAVGLQLAAGFLAGPDGPRSIDEFAGDVQSVDEYLADELLDQQSPRTRRFLLYTSICEPVCGDLADAITEETGGQRTLEELERVTHSVVRLGAKPRWFRYHYLVRDVLQHRLLVESPGVLPQLHRRAAGWYAENDSILEALRHAVAARDWPYVGRLVAQASPLIVSTHRVAVTKILQQMPPGVFASSAELTVCEAVLLLSAGDYEAVTERLATARDLLEGRAESERLPVDIAIRTLEAGVNRVMGDMPTLVAETTNLLTMLTRARFGRLSTVLQYRAIALCNKGVGLLWEEQPSAAERHLWVASTAARTAGVERVEISALGHLALLEVMFGSVQEASRLARSARDMSERRGWRYAPQAVPAHIAKALVEIERLDKARAERALKVGLRGHRGEPEAAHWKLWLGAQARLALAEQDPTTARELIDEARLTPYPNLKAPALDRWLGLAESEADLMSDQPERVQKRYDALRLDHALTFAERVCLARAAFAMRDVGRAEALLRRPGGQMSGTVATVEARILSGLVADAMGHGLRSADLLAEAVALAEHEGIRRPLLTMGGGRLDALITRRRLLSPANTAFIADVRGMNRAGRRRRTSALRPGPLSERETEVLQYLPTMLTAGEIAGELNVSVNTVKAHMRSIYRKLGAARRREAVAHAREGGLL